MKNSLQICKAVYAPKCDRIWSIRSLVEVCIHFLEHSMDPGGQRCGRREILMIRTSILCLRNWKNVLQNTSFMNKRVTDTFLYIFINGFSVKEDESHFNQNNCVALNSVCGLGISRHSLKRYDDKRTNVLSDGNLVISELWQALISILKITFNYTYTVFVFMLIYSSYKIWTMLCCISRSSNYVLWSLTDFITSVNCRMHFYFVANKRIKELIIFCLLGFN